MTRPDRAYLCQIAVAMLLLVACGLPARWAWGWSGQIRQALQNEGPNAADYERVERGYYEQLHDSARQLDRSTSITPHKTDAKPFDAGVLALVVNDAREYVLKPNLSTVHRGATWTTNTHGQRDRDRTQDKPADTFRIALVGDSIGSGWGVEDGQTFTRRVEAAFEQQGLRIEVLNFAMPGYAPGQRWEHFNRVGWDFQPDLVIFEGTAADPGWDERRIRAFVARGLGADSHVYGHLLRSIPLEPGTPVETAKTRLKPYKDQILPMVYRTIVDDCRARSIPCLWLMLPRVGKPATPTERQRLLNLTQTAGFDRAIDLADTFDGLPVARLAIAPDDFHPNAEGHARLADRLEQALIASSLLPGPIRQGGEPQ